MRKHLLTAAAALIMLALPLGAGAQWTQTTACPGWNNPSKTNTNQGFGAKYMDPNTGNQVNCYTGKTGQATSQTPNVTTQLTGATLSTSYTGAGLSSATMTGEGGYVSVAGATLPDNDKVFYINTGNGNDPNTLNHLPYVPTEFNTNEQGIVNTNITSTIRIGDGNGGGKAAMLSYEFVPTVENAIFIIYYAIVVQGPEHGTADDPSFVIRVMEKNASNQWVQKSDTLAYYIPSTCSSCNTQDGTHGSITEVPLGQRGWHAGATSYGDRFKYKDWEKVVINLSNCLDQPHRVEMIMRDCTFSAHCAYAYVAGECREMKLESTGCPPGRSTDVTTLKAPRGMRGYEWQASEYGYSSEADLGPGRPHNYFTFRTLSGSSTNDTAYDYKVQAADFQVMYRPDGAATPTPVVDSFGQQQIFRCMMTSALNPALPFTQPLYVDVENTKPSMKVDTLVECDGKLTVINKSEVPGAPNLVQKGLTQYMLYNNATGNGTYYDSIVTGSDTLTYQLTNEGMQSVVVRTFTNDPTCWSEEIYPVKPLHNPEAVISLSKEVLCDAEQVSITDNSAGVVWRQWKYLNPNWDETSEDTTYVTETGTSATDKKVQTRSFTHSIEPIELTVRNGMFFIDTTTHDTVWCEDKATDTVAVFLHPNLLVTGDTIVCEGSKTSAKVTAEGVDGCDYAWSLSKGSITGGLPAGDSLQVTPYSDVAKYYVKVTSPQGCTAWDSVTVYLVRPQLARLPEDGLICPGSTATLTGSGASKYTWEAEPADPSLVAANADSAAVVVVRPDSTTTYTMYGYGSNGCKATAKTTTITLLPLPKQRITLTPGYIDVDEPTVLLRDVSEGGVASLWEFLDDGLTETGREVNHTFVNYMDKEEVGVRLTSLNALDCPKDTNFAIPVKLFTTWFPNIFTPNSNDDNARFKLYTINEYEQFHIYIYDRRGSLVFESGEPTFEWDGTYEGRDCEQGAYVYICYYRKPGTPTLMSKKGTITLVR